MFTSTRLPIPLTREQPRVRSSVVPLARSALFGLALLVLALGLRWARLDADVTHDEDQWMTRAGNLAVAVREGAFARTFQSGHPGVLTMELAVLGQGPAGAARFADRAGQTTVVSARPGYFGGLLEARRPFVVTTAALVVLLALLAWRLLGPGPAVLGGLLLTLDPFILGHSRVVQMDGLLSGLMAGAALCGLIRWTDGGGRAWVLAGGLLSGLALLTKAPAAYLALFVPLLGLSLGRARGPRSLIGDLALWGAAGLVTTVALWPALWLDAPGVVARVIGFAGETGGRPHNQGNFFLGTPVADPGPLFYPLSAAFRLTPAALLGLFALALLPWLARGCLSPAHRRVVLGLVAYLIGFGLLVTVAQKKFDRYLLPAFPALDLLAGVGLWLAWQVLRRNALLPSAPLRFARRFGSPPAVALFTVALAIMMIWPAASVFPNYLTYYNPLLGGGQVAARLMLVGYGEGLIDAAHWINARPEAGRLKVAVDSHDVFQTAFVGEAIPMSERPPDSAAYVVLYHYQTQIRRWPRVLETYQNREPDKVIRLNGIDYVRIYRVSEPARRP